MIVALSRPPYEIGARRIGIRDGNANWHDQPFVLLREVTQADWIEQCIRVSGKCSDREIFGTQNDRFFEVATD